MTVIVGVFCQDGIVIGADSASTFGNAGLPTIEQPIQKIDILDNRIILAGTGEVGLGQRFNAIIKKSSSEEKLFSNKFSQFHVTKTLSKLAIQDFSETFIDQLNRGAGKVGFGYGALVAFPLGKNFHLCEFPTTNFQPELKDANIWYVSMGSGQTIVDPFLGFIREVFWEKGQPKRKDGLFATVWALQHAIDLNPGGIKGPIQLAELTLDKQNNPHARKLGKEEIDEHKQNMEGAKTALRNYRDEMLDNKSAKDLPPKPE